MMRPASTSSCHAREAPEQLLAYVVRTMAADHRPPPGPRQGPPTITMGRSGGSAREGLKASGVTWADERRVTWIPATPEPRSPPPREGEKRNSDPVRDAHGRGRQLVVPDGHETPGPNRERSRLDVRSTTTTTSNEENVELAPVALQSQAEEHGRRHGPAPSSRW